MSAISMVLYFVGLVYLITSLNVREFIMNVLLIAGLALAGAYVIEFDEHFATLVIFSLAIIYSVSGFVFRWEKKRIANEEES